MIDRLAKLLSQSRNQQNRSDRPITRRSLLARATQATAAAFVVGSSASTISLKAGALAPNACQVCNSYTGCSHYDRWDYCDDNGAFYKCCTCGVTEYPYPHICDTICIEQEVRCFSPEP